MKPRLLLVSPRPPARERREALAAELDVDVVAGSSYALLPVRVARALRRVRPRAVLAQSPYEAAGALAARTVARSRTPVIVDVHGDWRTATRLYGTRARRFAAPLGDRVARAALRRADAVRTVSDYTTALAREVGVEPAATFPAYMSLDAFTGPRVPLPPEPVALFVGVLERYKSFDTLADAWRLAAPRVPGARLRLVGDGTLAPGAARLVAELPDQTSWSARVPSEEVARALDASWFLVLPSRSEGMGRVIVEAFCRGRPVLGARAGSIPDLVEDGVGGLLVEPGRADVLADALVRLLADRALVERLADGASAAASRWTQTPAEWARRVRELVESV